MTKARNIANIASDGSALADGTINYSDVTGTPTLATVATSGSFNDLSNQPAAFDPNTLAAVAVSGAYADVTGTPAAALPLAGGTLTGNVNLGDNVKANFGAGSDLQIYHDGTNSYVKDAGTGDLYLQGAANVRITNASGQKMFLGQDAGETQLYYSGSEKLATTATGVTVTGTVAATSYTGDGSALTGIGSPVIGLGTGGTITTDGDYKVHKFTSSGTFTVTVAGQFEVLVRWRRRGWRCCYWR